MTVEPANFPMMEEERPRWVAVERRQRREAAAPSEIWEELPAVVVPVSLKTGFNWDIERGEALGRIPSSWVIVVVVVVVVELGCVVGMLPSPPLPLRSPSMCGLVIEQGTISAEKRPDFCAWEALRCEEALKASWSARLMLYRDATFSLVRPMGMMQSLASLTGLSFSSGHSCVGMAFEP